MNLNLIWVHHMSTDNNDLKYTGKGQASRLSLQHEIAGGPLGIFGEEAKKHDLNIGDVSILIYKALNQNYKNYKFRLRNSISKIEINRNLKKFNPLLGETLFVKSASIKPDGGVLEVKDKKSEWRVILVGESKHQGNDVEKIKAGIKQGKNKDQDFMAAGNAIERVHKNILEFRNLMFNELHFPYIVFFQGSNFATETFTINAPNGRAVQLVHNSGLLNRIDRVTAANYSAPINSNYCRNQFIETENVKQMLQIPSLYFQCNPWKTEEMYEYMLEIALDSISILNEKKQLP